MHFLGGLFISGGYLWILMFEVPHTLRSRIPIFLSTLIVMCCVGVAWEVFEYLTDSFTAINYTLDTTLDLLMDITGALVAYLIVKRI